MIVVGVSRFGFVAVTTAGVPIAAVPVLLDAVVVSKAPAAASCEAFVSATPKLPAAFTVGWIRN